MKATKRAVDDILRAVIEKQIWMALGWNDVKSRYHRSKLGALWANVSLMILVCALGPVYSRIMSVNLDVYLIHLLLGFVVWNYVSSIISECGREFITSTPYLVSFQLSYFTLIMRVVWRNFIVLAYQMFGFVLLAIIFGKIPQIVWLSIPFALLLITLNAMWIGLLVAVLATRYRDLDELMNNIIRLVFFITPIMWIPDYSEELRFIANINPFFHLIEIFRMPLANSSLPLDSWRFMVIMCLFGWLIALPVFIRYRSRIAFWL